MGRKSKTKGSAYELKIAKELSKWTGENVHRVPQSGAGGHTWGADSRMNGDIVFPVGSKNSLIYECKKIEGWGFHHLLLNIGQIKEWWEQVVLDSRRMKEHNMSPCLIFSKNRDKDYVILPYSSSLFYKLQSMKLPASTQQIITTNIRDEEQYFDVLLTTLESITQLEPEYIFDLYRNTEWDLLNEPKEEEK